MFSGWSEGLSSQTPFSVSSSPAAMVSTPPTSTPRAFPASPTLPPFSSRISTLPPAVMEASGAPSSAFCASSSALRAASASRFAWSRAASMACFSASCGWRSVSRSFSCC